MAETLQNQVPRCFGIIQKNFLTSQVHYLCVLIYKLVLHYLRILLAELELESYCKLLNKRGGIKRCCAVDCPKLDNFVMQTKRKKPL